MSALTLTFLGSGDAFGSGGRLQPCLHIDAGRSNKFLLDCGATVMVSIRKFNIDPNEISTIYISHMHGDHYAGVSFFVLDAQLVSKRTQPLTVYVPTEGREHLIKTMELLFPGSYASAKKFTLEIKEMKAEQSYRENEVEIVTYAVNHSGLDARALRLNVNGKVLAYSGDTQWHDALARCAANADLFICEAYYYERKVKYHLDFASLRENIEQITAKKIILTHMSKDMLAVTQDKLAG